MDKLWRVWSSEPALLISAIRAVIVCAVGFGLDLDAEQVTAIVVVLEAVFALFTRASVYAPATVETIRGRARHASRDEAS